MESYIPIPQGIFITSSGRILYILFRLYDGVFCDVFVTLSVLLIQCNACVIDTYK